MRQNVEEILKDVRESLEIGDTARLTAQLEAVHPADLADIYSVLNDDHRSQLVFSLPRGDGPLIAELDEAERSEAVEDIDASELSEVVTELDPTMQLTSLN
ncbi:MAG: hypothetical protein R3E58_08015 [Phycisphaerae bacterium]